MVDTMICFLTNYNKYMSVHYQAIDTENSKWKYKSYCTCTVMLYTINDVIYILMARPPRGLTCIDTFQTWDVTIA
jgi:hypothetical protein